MINNVDPVLRGGSYSVGSWGLRGTVRFRYAPKIRYGNLGFRLVLRKKT